MKVPFLALVCIFAIAASASAARILLQDRDEFNCPSGRWELDCDVTSGVVACEADKDGDRRPDITFTCPLPSAGQPIDCSQGLAVINDSCVRENAVRILASYGANLPTGGSTSSLPIDGGVSGDDDYYGDLTD